MSVAAAPYALDPFGPSANPAAYVACEASERARAALERSLDEGRVAALVGPPGYGKTQLLRLLGGREEERSRVAYVPFSTLSEDEFYALVLNLLGAPEADGDPRAAVLALAGRLASRGGIVILVDDAGAMSDEGAASLAALYREAQGSLRIALAAVAGPDVRRVCRAFGDAVDVIPLDEGMTQQEARRYVELRLAYGGARPELVAAFDEDTIEALHRASEGVPRRLNQAAEEIVRRAMPTEGPRLRDLSATEAPPAEPTPARERPVGEDLVRETTRHLVLLADRFAAEHEAPPPQAETPAPDAPQEPRTQRSQERSQAMVPLRVLPESAPPAESDSRPPPAPTTGAAPQPDAAGILLPDAFTEGPGEYRLVGGRFVDPATGQPPELPAATPADPIAHSEPMDRDPAPSRAARTRSTTEALRRKAAEVPPEAMKQRELPIRTLGLLGFTIGVLVALYGMSPEKFRFLEEEDPLPKPRIVFPTKPRVPEGEPAPLASEEAPAPQPSEAASQPQLRPGASPVARTRPEPSPAVIPARETTAAATPAPRPAPAAAPVTPPAPRPAAAVPVTPPAPVPDVPQEPIRVSINATPWAVIEVDGRVLGETPLAGVSLSPGVHQFRAIMPDGTTRKQAIEIRADNDTVVFR